MTLEEAMKKLDELLEARHALLDDIKKNHIHNANDERVYYRYVNADNIQLREHILKQIDKGKTEWKSLLNGFPLPDKPFNIADIQDAVMTECFNRIQALEKEEKDLGKYITNTFERSEIIRILNRQLDEKYKNL